MQCWRLWILLTSVIVQCNVRAPGASAKTILGAQTHFCPADFARKLRAQISQTKDILDYAHARVYELYLATQSIADVRYNIVAGSQRLAAAKTLRNFLAIPYPADLLDPRASLYTVTAREHLISLLRIFDASPDRRGRELWQNVQFVCTGGVLEKWPEDNTYIPAKGRKSQPNFPRLPTAIAEKAQPILTYRGDVTGIFRKTVYLDETYYSMPLPSPRPVTKARDIAIEMELKDLIESIYWITPALLRALFELEFWDAIETLRCSRPSTGAASSGLDCVLAIAQYGRQIPAASKVVQRQALTLQYAAVALYFAKCDFSSGTCRYPVGTSSSPTDQGIGMPSQPVLVSSTQGIGLFLLGRQPINAPNPAKVTPVLIQNNPLLPQKTPVLLQDTSGLRESLNPLEDATSLAQDNEPFANLNVFYGSSQSIGRQYVDRTDDDEPLQDVDSMQDHGPSQNSRSSQPVDHHSLSESLEEDPQLADAASQSLLRTQLLQYLGPSYNPQQDAEAPHIPETLPDISASQDVESPQRVSPSHPANSPLLSGSVGEESQLADAEFESMLRIRLSQYLHPSQDAEEPQRTAVSGFVSPDDDDPLYRDE